MSQKNALVATRPAQSPANLQPKPEVNPVALVRESRKRLREKLEQYFETFGEQATTEEQYFMAVVMMEWDNCRRGGRPQFPCPIACST